MASCLLPSLASSSSLLMLQLLLVAMAMAMGGGVQWYGMPMMARAARTGGAMEEKPDVAHDLNIHNFNASLWAAPASWALVEFYASWCPACKNYRPHYERVAKLFNGPNAAHPGILYVAKVDCAQAENQKLCGRFPVVHFPTLLWGMPSKFAWGEITSAANSGIEAVETNHKADGLLQWINKRLGKEYSLDDVAQELRQSSKLGDLFESKTVLYGHDLEEVAAQAYEIILQNKMLNQKSRAPFVAFLQLLLLHHPMERCRKGSAAILTSLENNWPISSKFEDVNSEGDVSDSVGSQPDFEALKKLKICGNSLPNGSWISCRGSRNDTRGYSCGLWLLFHSLAMRVDDSESSAAFEALHGFVNHFFTCEECREHFLQMSSRSRMDFVSRRDLVLWFWRAHNEVNKRVSLEETASGSGDPKFPKSLWPPKELCSSCRSSAGLTTEDEPSWNESAVYSYLLSFYGHLIRDISEKKGELVKGSEHISLDMEEMTSSSSVSVPIGAALGIAMASCGFGIIACYWRMQQKRRKQMRRRV